ncbi:MAG: P-loop NTPase family protein [Isosphaeraceae bacterium]
MNADLENDIDEIFCGRPRFVRLGKPVGGVSYLDVTDIAGVGGLPPHSRIVILVILLAIKDRASECRIEAWTDDAGERQCRMSHVVDGISYDLVPPPAVLAPLMIRDLKQLGGLRSWRGRLGDALRSLASRIDGKPAVEAASGLFRVGMGPGGGGLTRDVRVAVEPMPRGECAILVTPYDSPELSLAAQAALREAMKARQSRHGMDDEPAAEDDSATVEANRDGLAAGASQPPTRGPSDC